MRRWMGQRTAIAAGIGAMGLAAAAGAQPATCVSVCEQKVDACAASCEGLADAAYDDPASLEQCQLACARQLLVRCVQGCSQTNEVVANDYRIVAENPDRVPAAPPAPEPPAATEAPPQE